MKTSNAVASDMLVNMQRLNPLMFKAQNELRNLQNVSNAYGIQLAMQIAGTTDKSMSVIQKSQWNFLQKYVILTKNH